MNLKKKLRKKILAVKNKNSVDSVGAYGLNQSVQSNRRNC